MTPIQPTTVGHRHQHQTQRRNHRRTASQPRAPRTATGSIRLELGRRQNRQCRLCSSSATSRMVRAARVDCVGRLRGTAALERMRSSITRPRRISLALGGKGRITWTGCLRMLQRIRLGIFEDAKANWEFSVFAEGRLELML